MSEMNDLKFVVNYFYDKLVKNGDGSMVLSEAEQLSVKVSSNSMNLHDFLVMCLLDKTGACDILGDEREYMWRNRKAIALNLKAAMAGEQGTLMDNEGLVPFSSWIDCSLYEDVRQVICHSAFFQILAMVFLDYSFEILLKKGKDGIDFDYYVNEYYGYESDESIAPLLNRAFNEVLRLFLTTLECGHLLTPTSVESIEEKVSDIFLELYDYDMFFYELSYNEGDYYRFFNNFFFICGVDKDNPAQVSAVLREFDYIISQICMSIDGQCGFIWNKAAAKWNNLKNLDFNNCFSNCPAEIADEVEFVDKCVSLLLEYPFLLGSDEYSNYSFSLEGGAIFQFDSPIDVGLLLNPAVLPAMYYLDTRLDEVLCLLGLSQFIEKEVYYDYEGSAC